MGALRHKRISYLFLFPNSEWVYHPLYLIENRMIIYYSSIDECLDAGRLINPDTFYFAVFYNLLMELLVWCWQANLREAEIF